jgi:transposase
MSRKNISENLVRVKPGTLHAGIDLGLEENVAVVIDELARQLDRIRFRNDLEGYEYFKERIENLRNKNEAPEVFVAMEPTNMLWKLLANYLEQQEISYRLVNAYTVKKHREGDQLDRSKDDRRDAFTIADLSRTGKCTETQLQHGEYGELREYISLYYRLRRQICREKQYIWNSVGQLFPELWQVFKDYSGQTARAMLRTCAAASEIRTLTEDEFIVRVRQKFDGYRLYTSRLGKVFRLAQISVGLKQGVRGLQLALALHLDTLTWLQSQQGQVLEAIETSFLSLPESRYLLSVKGIGTLSGATILAEIGDPKRYRNARQLVKLAGIQPTPNRSGKKQRSATPMSHQGRPRLRGMLYLVCLRMIQDDQRFSELYQHLQIRKTNPLTKMQAVGVLMNKLTHILWALMKQQVLYDPMTHQSSTQIA